MRKGSKPDLTLKARAGRLRSPFVLTIAVGATGALATALACGTNDLPPVENQGTWTSPNGSGSGAGGQCSPEGETRSCHVNLGQAQGVQQCFQGTQTCIHGSWSTCGGSGVVQSTMALGTRTRNRKPPTLQESSRHPEIVGIGGPGAALTCNCVPQTCATLGVNCGHTDDGCGNDLNCGNCTANGVCVSGVCQPKNTSCTPRSMATACTGISCGQVSDGCNGNVSCGNCAGNGACVAGHCIAACVPLSQAAACNGIQCGHTDDGCGHDVNCGSCSGGQQCTNGVCGSGMCTPLSVAAACAGRANQCGTVSDGCGNKVDCGNCAGGGSIQCTGSVPTVDAGGAPGAPICSNDPCDPYCNEFDSDAGIGPPAGDAQTIFVPYDAGQMTPPFYGGIDPANPTGVSPNGSNVGCSGGKDDFYNNGGSSCSINQDCGQDSHCSSGTCVWNGGTGYFDPNCKNAAGQPAVDLTIGAPCANGNGYDIPICNRGGGNLPAGTIIAVGNSGNGGAGTWNCTTGNATVNSSCSYTLPAALGPGQCTDIDTTTPAGSACAVLEQGERDLYINYDKAVTECGTTFSGTGAGCMNNSAHTKATGSGCPNACGARGGCEQYTFTVDGGGSSGPQCFYSCQMDSYCSPSALGGSGQCVQFQPGNQWPETEGQTASGGVDLTIGPGCSQVEGQGFYHVFPVCNRGNTALTPSMSTTGQIAISSYPWQPPTVTLSPPYIPPGPCIPKDNTPLCHFNIPSSGIQSGQCVLVDFSGRNTLADGGTGSYICGDAGELTEPTYNQLLVVNSDYAISEDNLVPATALNQTTQPGCANNWGDQWAGAGGNSNNPPACSTSEVGYASQTQVYTYTPNCPPGYSPQWSVLTYSANIDVSGASNSAEVLFEAATAQIQLDGGLAPLTSYVVVADAKGLDNGGHNLGDPAVCGLGGPAATNPANACSNGNGNPTPPCCPKSIAEALEMPVGSGGLGPAAGLVAANHSVLSLKVTINPSTDHQADATLNNWQVAYDCIPSE